MPSRADLAVGLDHHNAGRLDVAADHYRTILEGQPRHAEALHLLGLTTHQRGNDPAARDLIGQAIAISPRVAVYRANLGVVLLRLRLLDEAANALRAAIRLHPADFAAHANLGVALSGLGDHVGAAKAAGAALRLRPHDPGALCNRGLALQAAAQYEPALAAFDAAISADPGSYLARLSRGNALLALGRTAEALAALDAAIPLRPDDARAGQARIVAMNYLPGVTMAAIGQAARRLASLPPGAPPSPFIGLDRSSTRPLRIGYVSADFRNHPVGYFLESVLARRDPGEAVAICYDNGQAGDAMTTRLQAVVDHWRPIAGLDDARAEQVVRADRIDILVDLAGHTQGNRLGLFARRAAPVQAAWLGYFGTTGLAAMDAVIADRHVLPASDEPHFGERVVRLPDSYLCYSPPVEAGPVAPLPAGLTHPVTFGCFNNRAKLNQAVLALWARVLHAVPRARLLLKSAQYADKSVRRDIVQQFGAAGVVAERILFEPASPIAAMFAAYGRVDIAFDPHPFAGGATTVQALWMGVPVISLVGQTWPGRQGASLLTAAGFPQWAVTDEDCYVELARSLAADRLGLAALRLGLRARVAASPLCQADRFAGHLQQAYRGLWLDYLAAAPP